MDDSGLIFKCPGCDAQFEADLSLIGTESSCPECNIHFIVPIPETNVGMELAGFRLKRKLGEGGMGEVWLAAQVAMSRDVALKILSPKLVSDPDFIRRFDHEIRIAGKLHHPNIITAFDAGHMQGLYYLAMNYVDGIELSDRLKIDHKIPEKEALQIARAIASALDYAWSEFKILHRDIKPSNIMLDKKGQAMLMDMGISKCMIEDASMTISGTVVGTPYYISPEQARGDKQVDFHSDIYSLGATLYHIVTGKFPFDGETTMVIMTRHITDKLMSPKEHYPGVSDPFCRLIGKMMDKDQKKRQASWKHVIKDIDLVLAGKNPEIGPGVYETEVHVKKLATPMPDKTMAMPSPASTIQHTPINITINRPASTIKHQTTAAATPPIDVVTPASTPISNPVSTPGSIPSMATPPPSRSAVKIKTPTPATTATKAIPTIEAKKQPTWKLYSDFILYAAGGIMIIAAIIALFILMPKIAHPDDIVINVEKPQ